MATADTGEFSDQRPERSRTAGYELLKGRGVLVALGGGEALETTFKGK
ncbi:hypothetical protein SCAB_29151 [Streptomyces scabiei 87.22]|uniref:Uncharacterized protein n=1 Tax=Streptomyces scabiei (strain 87.22) TaxID=680198 RepID=C9Z8I9_STRSW|nr:hypothetical protein SCAB_29151 [Streptomyces scabiei 87.22]